MHLNQIPNIITGMRLLAVPPAIYLMWVGRWDIAFLVFAFAGVSDGVDGYLARRFGWQSKWGATMDPVADKLLLVSTAAMLLYQSLLPLWLFVLMFGRDLMILGGAALYHWKFGPYKIQPTWLGKASTFVQILLLLSMMVHAAFGILSEEQIDKMIFMCGLITVVSGAHYAWIWIRKALNE